MVVRPTVLPACCAIADMRARLEWDKEGVRVFESAASTRAMLLRCVQVAVCVREYARRRGDEPNYTHKRYNIQSRDVTWWSGACS